MVVFEDDQSVWSIQMNDQMFETSQAEIYAKGFCDAGCFKPTHRQYVPKVDLIVANKGVLKARAWREWDLKVIVLKISMRCNPSRCVNVEQQIC